MIIVGFNGKRKVNSKQDRCQSSQSMVVRTTDLSWDRFGGMEHLLEQLIGRELGRE